MKNFIKSQTFVTGLAMFAMFFGAGNVIFPLTIGYLAQDKTLYGIFGLLLTAVIVPFTGLIAMMLYEGDYNKFFEKIGRLPGFIVAALIMALIGPFGATPRCIAAGYSTLKANYPDLSMSLFSAAACLIIFLFTYRKNRILDMIGYVLTPALLGFLGFMIVKGMFMTPGSEASSLTEWNVFFYGLNEGYNTMDLLGAFFFAPVILSAFKSKDPSVKADCPKTILSSALKASYIGAFLLAVIYVGFCFIASFHTHGLEVASDQLIGALALRIVGLSAGLVTAVIVALACLTTAIALTTVFAEFLQNVICRNRISYHVALVVSLVVTYFFATLEFSGITAMLGPILQVGYPALMVLTVLNILDRLGYATRVKELVFMTFAVSIFSYVWW